MDTSTYYIVLDFFDGNNLDSLIQEGRNISLASQLKLIIQILDAVIYAHSKNIIHRDLKPSNILVDLDFNVKVIDFGISRFKNSIFSEDIGRHFGSYKYTSYEQRAGKDITPDTDIYALGIILYEILIGKMIKPDEIDGIKKKIEVNHFARELGAVNSILLRMIGEGESISLSEIRSFFGEVLAKYRQTEGKCYILGFTNRAVKKLADFGYIDQEKKEVALHFIEKDLSKENYINIDKLMQNQEGFNLLGDVGNYKCVVDQRTRKSLTVIDVWFHPYETISHYKESSMRIDEPIKVVLNPSAVELDSDVNELLQKLKNYSIEVAKSNFHEEHKKVSLEKWGSALELYRREIEDQKQTLKYKRFEIMNDSNFIKVYTKDELEDNPFDESSLICMSKKYKIEDSITVGYCISGDREGVIIQLNKDIDVNRISESGEISIQKNHLLISLDRQKRALKTLQYQEMQNNAIGEILLDPTKAISSRDTEIKDYVQDLDKNKKDAVYKALNSKDIFLLQGPPGTGKTTFITELVAQIILKNPDSRILITSQSHIAVDHALKKITESQPNIKVLRIGREEKMSLGSEQYMLDNQLMNWLEGVRNRCSQYMQRLKDAIQVNSKITTQYNLIQDLEGIDEQLDKLQYDLLELKKEELCILEKYQHLQKITSEVNSVLQKIKNRFDGINDNQLIEIAENFEKDFSKLGERFISEFESISLVSDKKQSIELKILEKELLELECHEKKDTLYTQLGISNVEDLGNLKQDIIKQFDKNQEEYKKIRKLEKIHEEWMQRLAPTGPMGLELIRDVNIIGATCLGIATLPATTNIVFDWVIIDEAARATVPEVLIPIVQGKKVVLVGDHKQLPPVIDKVLYEKSEQDIKISDLQRTLFEELIEGVNESCKGVLSEQYRMHPSIGNLISEVFYEGILKSSPTTEKRNHGIERWKDKGVVWISTANCQNRYEQLIEVPHQTYQNSLECEQIISVLKELNNIYREKSLTVEIGVITGYQAQRNLLKKKIESQKTNDFSNIILDINTVDAFQGRETDIIIYSVVRSNKEKQIGFLADERRLNVALSRARDLLIIVGDDETVQHASVNNNPFKGILRYIKDNPTQCKIEEWGN